MSGCKGQEAITNNYNPVPLTRPGQTRQLYEGYVLHPTPSLTPDSDFNGVLFSLLGYGAIPYVIANGEKLYIFPLVSDKQPPTITVEKGVVVGARITLDQGSDVVHVVTRTNTQYPYPGITYWEVRVALSDLKDWDRPVLHIAYGDVYINDGTSYVGNLYYPLGR